MSSLFIRVPMNSRDTSSLDSGSQDILVGWHIIRIRDPSNSVEVAVNQLRPIPNRGDCLTKEQNRSIAARSSC